MERHKEGEVVTAHIDGRDVTATVIEVKQELMYTVELPDGSQRAIAHCDIN